VILDPLIKNVENGFKTALQGAFSGTDIANSFIGKFFSGTLFGGAETGVIAAQTANTSALWANTAALGGSTGAGAVGDVTGLAGGAAAAAGGGGLFGWLGSLFGGSSALPSAAALLAFAKGGIVPSAAGGWAVPALGSGGTLARLHSNEMVLPANISQGLQDMIGGGGAGTAVHHHWHVSAVDAAGVAKFFRSNAPALVAAVNHGTRNGSMLRTS
jgi:hypothetical protein